MKQKHTYGTWELGDENNSSAEVSIQSGPHTLTISLDRYDRFTGKMVISREEMLANAHLIISAPELLEALQEALDLIWLHSVEINKAGVNPKDVITKAEAAIKKATV